MLPALRAQLRQTATHCAGSGRCSLLCPERKSADQTAGAIETSCCNGQGNMQGSRMLCVPDFIATSRPGTTASVDTAIKPVALDSL